MPTILTEVLIACILFYFAVYLQLLIQSEGCKLRGCEV